MTLKVLMRGRIGVTMSIYGTVLPGASLVASLARRTNISKEAKKKLAGLITTKGKVMPS